MGHVATNRSEQHNEHGAGRPGPGDYFIVCGESFTWYVSTTMAKAIEARLDARRRPRWVTFVDLTGSRVRLRARRIEYVCQCTAEQRTAERAFFRSLKRERKADPSWEDED
jgi:hypothetical protein